MRKTVYLTLAALGAASIATAAVVTTEAPPEPVATRVTMAATATHHIRAVASETESTENTKVTKRECRHHCPFFGD
jgi:hypothetical protein